MGTLIEVLVAMFMGASPADASTSECLSLNSDRAVQLRESFGQNERHTFFVGLWSKLESADRTRLNWFLESEDDSEMLAGIQEMQAEMSNRLLRDREKLQAWVRSKGLTEEIEVSEVPADGSFVLFSTTKLGLNESLCAAEAGDIPSVFDSPGF